jgi:serine/threonine protein phosphatase 1
MPSRIIAIGDIHGCLCALDAVLTAIEPERDDLIVTLGDYVNRGPDSRGVIERMIALEGVCTLVPLLGNHDQMLLDARARRPRAFSHWIRLGGGSTLLSYGVSPGPVSGADLARVPPEHVAFLERCRDWHETESHIFVHAKYNPALPMDRQLAWLLRWESLSYGIPGPHVSGKTVIAGHSSQKNGEVLDLGHLICIDTRCYDRGWLTAMDVQTRTVWQGNEQGMLRRA